MNRRQFNNNRLFATSIQTMLYTFIISLQLPCCQARPHTRRWRHTAGTSLASSKERPANGALALDTHSPHGGSTSAGWTATDGSRSVASCHVIGLFNHLVDFLVTTAAQILPRFVTCIKFFLAQYAVLCQSTLHVLCTFTVQLSLTARMVFKIMVSRGICNVNSPKFQITHLLWSPALA